MSPFRWIAPLVLGWMGSSLVACERGPELEPLAPEVRAALDTVIQDEYHAENVFLRVLSEHGEHPAFMEPLYGEIQHTTRIAHLYLDRGLDVPVSRWNVTNVPSYPTIQEACAAAVEIERRNIALYDRFLELDLPPDVRAVFTEFRLRSRDEHLPAFEACAA